MIVKNGKYINSDMKRNFLTADNRIHPFWRSLIAALLFSLTLILVNLGDMLNSALKFPINAGVEIVVTRVLMGLVVLGEIYLLRRFVDKRPWKSLSLLSSPIYLLSGAGLCLLAGMLAVGLFFASGQIQFIGFALTPQHFTQLLLSMLVYFSYEPFSEELIFRGYGYHALNTWLPRWLAVLVQIIFFVASPLFVLLILALFSGQFSVYRGDVLLYAIGLALFALPLHLCAIATRTTWMGMGYHMLFIQFSPIIGYPYSLIQVHLTSLSPVNFQFFCTYTLSILASLIVLCWHYLRGHSFGWRERIQE